jgi:hypothetical protein
MDEARVEKVARALSRHAGEDPNRMVSNAGGIQVFGGNESLYPRWHDYRDEARKFIVMYDALNS